MGYYEENKPTICVGVLGEIYELYLDVSKKDDPELEMADGYCDQTLKRIVVCDSEGTDMGNWEEYKKYCIRHELIHAFLFESGISGCVKWDVPGETHPEHIVEWMGIQFPKLLEAFRAAGAI